MELIGTGATSEVFKVFCPYRNRESARKVYFNGFEKLAQAEYETLKRLASNPCIPEAYSFDSNTLELEYCPKSVSEAAGNDWKKAVSYVRDAADTIHFAHMRGVLHLDLKPDHLRVGADSRVRVLDFGNKTAPLEDLLVSAKENNAFMTRLFAAPEQLAKEPVGPETDVYGLGATLYHLLTKQFPIGCLKPVSSYNSEISKELDSVVFKAMAHEKTDRYRTASEFSSALGQILIPKPRASHSLYFRDGVLAMTIITVLTHEMSGESMQSIQGSFVTGAFAGLLIYFASKGQRRLQQ